MEYCTVVHYNQGGCEKSFTTYESYPIELA